MSAEATPTLEGLKRYTGALAPEDEPVLELALEAAIEWFKASGVPDYAQNSRLWVLAVYELAAHKFENRGAVGGETPPIPRGIFGLAHTLKHTPAPVREEAAP